MWGSFDIRGWLSFEGRRGPVCSGGRDSKGGEIGRQRERGRERKDRGMLPICIVPYIIILMSMNRQRWITGYDNGLQTTKQLAILRSSSMGNYKHLGASTRWEECFLSPLVQTRWELAHPVPTKVFLQVCSNDDNYISHHRNNTTTVDDP